MRRIEDLYTSDQLQTASPLRRLGGAVLDTSLAKSTLVIPLLIALAVLISRAAAYDGPSGGVMEADLGPDEEALAAAIGPAAIALGLTFVPLAAGWLVWFILTARNGQTPAKQLLGMYIMREDGSRAGGWYVALRELVIKEILFVAVVGSLTSYIGTVVAAAWCLGAERQCLWDKVAGSYVAHSPGGFRPETAAETRVRGQPRTALAPADSNPIPAPSGPLQGERQRDASSRLRELQRLRNEGLIEHEEYEAQRARILDED